MTEQEIERDMYARAVALIEERYPTGWGGAAVLRTEEKSRSRFAKDLHDGLGPLLSSARMSLSALQRESLPADQQEIIGKVRLM